MNLEEDAMLVAIGRMSMDEAREKWADQWSDFCRSLTRWKSVHQLFRLAQLNKTLGELDQSIKETKTQDMVYRLCVSSLEQQEKIFTEKYTFPDDGYAGTINASRRRFAMDRGGAPGIRGGMINPKTSKNWRKTLAEWFSYGPVKSAEFEHKLYVKAKKDLEESRAKRTELGAELDDLKQNQLELQDRYDATKSYAMGLLVADIFYSMAAAIQGDIY